LAVRSFNQAAWLAQAVARAGGKPWKPGALQRVKRRKSQAGLSASERRRNVGGAIKAWGNHQGKTILVVDDVFTTGATYEAARAATALADVSGSLSCGGRAARTTVDVAVQASITAAVRWCIWNSDVRPSREVEDQRRKAASFARNC
jgi:hypothetical protein